MKKYVWILMLLAAAYIKGYAQEPSPKAPPAESGKMLYETHCLTCHQADGSGVPRMNPPLIKTSYITGNKKKLVQWVLRGSPEEKIPIDGEHYSNNMPPQNYLKDKEIAGILSYVRKSFGNKASAVTASEVKSIRAVTKLN